MDEQLTITIFQIISAAGSAKSNYMEAMAAAREGHFEDIDRLIKEGDEMYKQGHDIHLDLMGMQDSEQGLPISLILIHAEDQMMSAEQTRVMAEEFISLYKDKYGVKAWFYSFKNEKGCLTHICVPDSPFCPKPCRGTDVDDEVLNHEENETVRGERCAEFAACRNDSIPVFSSIKMRCTFLHIFCTSENRKIDAYRGADSAENTTEEKC